MSHFFVVFRKNSLTFTSFDNIEFLYRMENMDFTVFI
jgi:hypothetical protein